MWMSAYWRNGSAGSTIRNTREDDRCPETRLAL